MRISEIIEKLKATKAIYGDLPVFTEDSDIGALEVLPCRDGVQRTIDGEPDGDPNELVLLFHPSE